MAVYQTQRGWGVDFRDEFGRRHRRHVGTSQQAQHLADILEAQIQQTKRTLAKFRTESPLKLSDGAQLFLNAQNTTPKTKENHQKAFKALIRLAGDIPAAQLTPKLMAAYHQARAQELAPSTLAKESASIKAMFRYLATSWGIPEGAALTLPTKYPRRSAGVFLSFQEEERALQTCSTPKSRLKILLGIDAGLRSGELALLRNNSINHQDGEITVWPSKPGRTRIVPMTPRLKGALAVYTQGRGQNPDAQLFPCKGKKQTDPASFLGPLRAKGAPPFRFHDLRHTFASRLAEIGTARHVISALLGHSSRGTTDIYIHASRQQLHQAIENLAAHTAANPIPLTGELI